jgi:uncharacterized membrane protein YgcG
VLLNHRRKSTVGWNIANVLLDFTGGAFSLAQLFVDTAACSKCALTGAKLAIAGCSVFFDVVFMVQHFVLYRHNRADPWGAGGGGGHGGGGSHGSSAASSPGGSSGGGSMHSAGSGGAAGHKQPDAGHHREHRDHDDDEARQFTAVSVLQQ